MAEQQSRLAIVLDSTGAQRNAEGLAGALTRMSQAGQKAADSSGKTTKATEDEAKALSTLLDRIDPVNAALNRLDEQQQQLAKLQAKGFIDTDTFDTYSKKIEEARGKLTSFNDGMDKGATSAGQYKAAMRQLPAQFTDIFTSLAGGMPLWLVFTQQGGQIADSFGGWSSLLDVIKHELLGMSSANDEASESLSESANGLSENVENGKKLLSFLTPAKVALAGTAAAVAALSIAYYQGSKEQDEFAKSLALTGNILGTTTGHLADMASQVAASADATTSDAANVINQLVGAGKIAGDSMDVAAKAILNLNDAAGIATEQLVEDFNAIAQDPVAAIGKLNDKYHFLTLATYSQIAALQEQGNQQEAAKVATNAYAAAISDKGDKIQNSLGGLESAWKALGDTAKKAWDSMLDVGREEGPGERVAEIQKQLDWIDKASGGNTFFGGRRKELQQELNVLQAAINAQGDMNGALAASQRAQDKAIKTQQDADRVNQQYLSNADRRVKAIKEQDQFLKAGAISAEQYSKNVARINEMYQDPKTPKGRAYTENAGTRMLDELRQQQQLLVSQSDTNAKIGTQAQALIKWEQQLADIKSKQTLTADQKSLLTNADLITSQLQQNAALERQIETREKLLALDRARADIARTISNRQSQYATDELFSSGGMSQYDQQQYTQRLSLEQSYNEKITQLRQQRASASSDIARDEIDQEIQLQQQALSAELSNYDAHIERMNASRRSFTSGASRAWQEYQDSAENVSAQSQQLFTNAFSGMEDALVNFVVTGKASFKDFATSVISDLARIAARQALVGLGSSILGSLFSAGASATTGAASTGATGGLGMSTDFHAYAKGGVPGGNTISAYRNGVYDSPQYFAFAKGAGVFGEAGPEAIMPLARSSDGSLGVRMISGGGSTGINVSAPVTIVQQQGSDAGAVNNANTASTAKQLEGIIKQTLATELKKQMGPGGVLYTPSR